MGGRGILRSSISLGLVSIPVELHPTTQSKAVHFNLLHEKDDSRIPEKIYCVAEGKQIDQSELVHGFKSAKASTQLFGAGFGGEETEDISEPRNRTRPVLANCGSRPGLLRGFYLLPDRSG